MKKNKWGDDCSCGDVVVDRCPCTGNTYGHKTCENCLERIQQGLYKVLKEKYEGKENEAN